MFSTEDSIVAIATPQGCGGIGVIRISGSASLTIAAALLDHQGPLIPRYATVARIRCGAVSDEVVATYFQAPHSYTGEDVVEVSAHGSPIVLRAILASALECGARLAEPGEFTLRAFLNGKRDLVQAEAVADLIEAATPLQARVAFDQLQGTLTQRIADIDARVFELMARLEASLDFPDEGYHFVAPGEAGKELDAVMAALDELLRDATRGRMIREGATVVVAGRPNVGKSSVFNKLLGTDRAIVTSVPGTTRDLIAERVDLDGVAVTLIDTAGWHDTLDVVEREGVTRGAHARGVADLIVLVLDRSEPLTDDDERLLGDTAAARRVVVANKVDLPACTTIRVSSVAPLEVSARTNQGISELRRHIAKTLTGQEALRDTAVISNTRHIALLEAARADLLAAKDATIGQRPEEFVLVHLQNVCGHLDEVVGRRTSAAVLHHIFERFCIGK